MERLASGFAQAEDFQAGKAPMRYNFPVVLTEPLDFTGEAAGQVGLGPDGAMGPGPRIFEHHP